MSETAEDFEMKTLTDRLARKQGAEPGKKGRDLRGATSHWSTFPGVGLPARCGSRGGPRPFIAILDLLHHCFVLHHCLETSRDLRATIAPLLKPPRVS